MARRAWLHRGRRLDMTVAAGAAALFAAAVLVGRYLEHTYGNLHLGWPPLFALWQPHAGPGTPAAVAVAAVVVWYGPGLAARLGWRGLLWAGWAASLAWISSLALVDGWHRGVATRLTTSYEYLQGTDRFRDIPAALRHFTDSIVISPGAYHWPAHIAGHPPAAVLTFVGLDRAGLGGGGWAAVFVLVVGSSGAAAVLVALKALADETTARRAAPFLVLAPAAVWTGVSADGYFAAVAAWALALLALAATRTVRSPATAALGSGLLFGLTCYLSYGLTLIAVVAAAVLLAARTARPLPLFLCGALVVPAAFTFAGFDWWAAYRLLVVRYYQGAGAVRPYGYWIWADPACAVLLVGLAGAGGVARALPAAGTLARRVRTGPSTAAGRLAVVVAGALLALVLADLSGMSKAETERIWLPFALWLLPGTALLPAGDRRGWLTAQALLALLVNHLLLTGW